MALLKKDKYYIVFISREDDVSAYQCGEERPEELNIKLLTSSSKAKINAFYSGMNYAEEYMENLNKKEAFVKWAFANCEPFRV